jgi:hypothetical protein
LVVIVFLKYVFTLLMVLKDRSAVAVETGIHANMLALQQLTCQLVKVYDL